MLAAAVSAAQLKFDFGEFQAGESPTNFHAALAGEGQPAQWKIVMDDVPSAFTPLTDKAPSVNQRGVLAQQSEDMTDEHFPMFVYDGDTFHDFTFSTRFKIVSGLAEQMAGIVFRYQNTSNFYVLRASALGHNVRFYKVVDGIRADPLGPQLDVVAGAWHTLAVQCHGNEITCFFDGKPIMPPLQDNSFSVGQIGFWTKSDSVSYFSDATLDYTPRIPAAQSLVDSIMEKQPRILTLRIYTLDDKGEPKIIASNVAQEVGQPGETAEKIAISDGTVSFGKSAGVVAISLPFRDRNGDPIAAVRVRLKSFFGETQENAVTRASLILKQMEAQITTSKDLLE